MAASAEFGNHLKARQQPSQCIHEVTLKPHPFHSLLFHNANSSMHPKYAHVKAQQALAADDARPPPPALLLLPVPPLLVPSLLLGPWPRMLSSLNTSKYLRLTSLGRRATM